VVPTTQLRMKSGAHFEQRCHAATGSGDSRRRFRDSRQYLQHRALPCAVRTDETDHLASVYRKRHVLERPQRVVTLPSVAVTPKHGPEALTDMISQRVMTTPAE